MSASELQDQLVDIHPLTLNECATNRYDTSGVTGVTYGDQIPLRPTIVVSEEVDANNTANEDNLNSEPVITENCVTTMQIKHLVTRAPFR